MISELKSVEKIVGIKQVKKALKNHQTSVIYLALDADPYLTESVREAANETDVPVIDVPSKAELGISCGIQVAAACVGVLR